MRIGTSGVPRAVPGPVAPEVLLSLPDEPESDGGFITVAQAWVMVRAHLLVSIGMFLLLVVLAYFAIKSLPKSYESTATLIVQQDNYDPLAGRDAAVGQNWTFLPTQVELIYNRTTLRPVADRLNLWEDPAFNAGLHGDRQAMMDTVLGALYASLYVRPGQNSQLIYISATADSGQRAAEIANAVADEYLLQMKGRINAPAMERATRYNSQLAELKLKVDQAQSKVEEFRGKHGMANMKDGQDLEGAALADLQAQLLEAQNARRQLESSNEPDLQERLDGLHAQMAQVRTTMGARHPRVLELQSEIKATQDAMASGQASRIGQANQLESRLRVAIESERARLLERRSLQDEGSRLLLEQRLAEEGYSKALGGLDEIQFASEGNYQDVALVSRAEPPLIASKPNKLKYFAAALLLSLALSVGGPLAFELLLDRRVRCRDDLERGFRIVTLAEFGPIPRTAEA